MSNMLAMSVIFKRSITILRSISQVTESEKRGLCLNEKKTELMVFSMKKMIPSCKITTVNNTTLKQVNSFKYLGKLITLDGRCEMELNNRITQAKVM